MSVRVLYFGSLREKLGRAEDHYVAADESDKVIDIWNRLNPELPLPDKTLCAVDQEYVKADTAIGTGHEVAFFPPVTGG